MDIVSNNTTNVKEHMSGANRPSRANTPGWVKLLGMTGLLLILIMGLLHLKHLKHLVGFDHESGARQTTE
jgi:hypothetical protein